MKVPFRRTSPAPQDDPVPATGDQPAAAPVPAGTGHDTPTAVMAAVAAPDTVPAPATAAPATALDPPAEAPATPRSGYGARGKLRRRLLYLRRARELGMRDLGGLVFELHRFGRRNDAIVTGKLNALAAIDHELRELERVLGERRDFTELREAGVATCQRCGELHGSDARFCPACGTPLAGDRAPARPEAPAVPPATVAPPLPAPAPVPQSDPAAPLWHTPAGDDGPPAAT